MSSVILEAHDLTKEYRHTVALDHIDLKIEKGKNLWLHRPKWSRKDHLLRLVTGLAFPTSGTLSLWGKNRRKGIAGTEKADRLHDRNTCAFSDNDRLSKYGDTAYPTWYPLTKQLSKNFRHGRSERYREKSCP